MIELDLNNEKDLAKIKAIGKALSSLKRLEILKITKKKTHNYTEIAEQINRSPTSLTNHMKWIKLSGLVDVDKEMGSNGKSQKVPKLKIKEIKIKL